MYTNIGLCSLTTGVVFSFQSSMTFIDKQQWIQNACINHNLLYISTQCALTGEVIMLQKQETNMLTNCPQWTEDTKQKNRVKADFQ